MTPSDVLTLTARWVLPVDRAPLERGTVTIAGERLVAVEPHGARTAEVDLGNAAILPGLVNAHTHLDLSGMRGKCPPSSDFVGWLRQVIAHRRTTTSEETQADIRAGIAECLRFGTTLIGDISSGGQSWDALAESPLRSVVFHEMLGLTVDRAEVAARQAEEWLATHPATPTCRPGLSPHAPYSVRQTLYETAAELARRFSVPLATHLAETAIELDLLARCSGPFLDFLTALGVWDPEGLLSRPSQYGALCRGSCPTLFVHCNFLGPETLLVPAEDAVVTCPRTHAAFGHPPHPFRAFLAKGVRVALGTDGLASNPDLDLLAEARFLHRQYPDFDGATLLRMATLAGAEALGWADETGSLTPGKSADLVTVPLPDADDADPQRLLFGSSAPVQGVMSRGRWLRSLEDTLRGS